MNGVIVITGGAGFIGSNFVHTVLSKSPCAVLVIDDLTYAGNLRNLENVCKDTRYRFIKANILDGKTMEQILWDYKPWAVVNFAAETHVDRSIDDPRGFVETNVAGTFTLLETTRRYLHRQRSVDLAEFRFLQVSTDEVYGSLGASGLFSETSPYAPSSPYAASKAGADHLVQSYHKTYGLPTLITHGANSYGPYQFPEKLIPLMILNALHGQSLPIYGDGHHIRDWLYVEDHCEGILAALEHGTVGERYNLAGRNEQTNLEVVEAVCRTLEECFPASRNPALEAQGKHGYKELKVFVPDRPGHDRRYAMDFTKAARELSWAPRHDFEEGLRRTVQWYLNYLDWCVAVQGDTYHRERLGLQPIDSEAKAP